MGPIGQVQPAFKSWPGSNLIATSKHPLSCLIKRAAAQINFYVRQQQQNGAAALSNDLILLLSLFIMNQTPYAVLICL